MKKSNDKAQAEKFKDAARDLACDEDPTHFDEALKKVARHKPAPKKDQKKAPDAKPPRSS